jgi:hypothetical protein
MLIIRFLTTEINVRQMRSLGIINNELKKYMYSILSIHIPPSIQFTLAILQKLVNGSHLQYLDHTLRAWLGGFHFNSLFLFRSKAIPYTASLGLKAT